jgi:hypothetical protein
MNAQVTSNNQPISIHGYVNQACMNSEAKKNN